MLPPQSPRGFSALARLYYLAPPTKTAMLRRLLSQGRIEEYLFRGGPTCAYEANNFQVLSLQTLGTKLVTNLFCYVHPQRHDTNGTHHILLVTTSSPVRFSLAFKVGREKTEIALKVHEGRKNTISLPHLQSKGKSPWGRGCTRKGRSFETIVPSVKRQNSYVQIYSNADQIP